MAINPTIEKALQSALVDLTDLHLLTKQAHWNIKGANFRDLHLALDEITDEVREAADEIAERMAALGGAPDARSATVAATTQLEQLDGGPLRVEDVYVQMEKIITGVSERMKANIDAVDELDHLSADILIGTCAGLEKQAWFLRAAAE